MMPAHSENDEKCVGSKICNSVHMTSKQFENGRKFDDKNSLQDFDARKMYVPTPNEQIRLVPKTPQKMIFLIVFQCSQDAISMPVRVQFSKSTVFEICWQKCAVFV